MTRRFRSGKGAALIELALVTPLLVMLVLGSIDFARVFYTANALSDVVRDGAYYGTTTSTFDASAIQSVAAAAAPSVSYTVDTPTRSCACLSDSGSQVSTLASCSNSCPSGHSVPTVTVTARSTFTTVSAFPGIPRSITLVRSASMRAQ